MKKSAKGKSKGSGKFDTLSESQREALCHYIYEFMVEKGFTNPDGYPRLRLQVQVSRSLQLFKLKVRASQKTK